MQSKVPTQSENLSWTASLEPRGPHSNDDGEERDPPTPDDNREQETQKLMSDIKENKEEYIKILDSKDLEEDF